MSRAIVMHHRKGTGVMHVFDGRQLTAARALAGLTVIELAQAASVAARTIHRLEVRGAVPIADKIRHGHVSQDVWAKITDPSAVMVSSSCQRAIPTGLARGGHCRGRSVSSGAHM